MLKIQGFSNPCKYFSYADSAFQSIKPGSFRRSRSLAQWSEIGFLDSLEELPGWFPHLNQSIVSTDFYTETVGSHYRRRIPNIKPHQS